MALPAIDLTRLGLYAKYTVKRNDDVNGKHDDCPFFVLDIKHDIHARRAVEEYIFSCFTDSPTLAQQLQDLLDDTELEKRNND